MEKTTCLAASAVVELLMDDILSLDGKKLSIQAQLPESKKNLLQTRAVFGRKKTAL